MPLELIGMNNIFSPSLNSTKRSYGTPVTSLFIFFYPQDVPTEHSSLHIGKNIASVTAFWIQNAFYGKLSA